MVDRLGFNSQHFELLFFARDTCCHLGVPFLSLKPGAQKKHTKKSKVSGGKSSRHATKISPFQDFFWEANAVGIVKFYLPKGAKLCHRRACSMRIEFGSPIA